jgi:hypothetical protein
MNRLIYLVEVQDFKKLHIILEEFKEYTLIFLRKTKRCQHVNWSDMETNVQDWSPPMNFILKGSQISTMRLKGWFKSKTPIQEYRNEIQNPY